MQDILHTSVHTLLAWLALPSIGLSAIFVVSTLAATLLPLGSEPLLFAYVREAPDMYWQAILVATAGNTLGGIISYAMGRAAKHGVESARQHTADGADMHGSGTADDRWHAYARHALDRLGPPAMLLAWLPVIGDPLCAVAGWLRLRFWPSVIYMAIGKFVRYLSITGALVWLFPGATG